VRGARHAAEGWLLAAAIAGLRLGPLARARRVGAMAGALAHALGARRRVAEENLRLAFPELDARARGAILRAHYRELGTVVAEYARLADLARAPLGEAIAAVRGLEHIEAARAAGRGGILLTGHFSNFELLGAWLAQRHPVDAVVRALSNPRVEAWIARERRRAGFGLIDAGRGLRALYQALRANRLVAILADQDARRAGVFVPFLGRPASTPVGPARLALATGAPILMGFVTRAADGRLELEVEPPLAAGDRRAPQAAERLTALHTARLEAWVRRRPELWFWLHRRWKTRPAAAAGEG